MIELARFKRLVALGALILGAVIGVVVVRQAADAVLRAASGADPTAIFNEPPPAPSELLGVIDWLPDPPRDGRAMEPATRAAITDAYARGLAALDRAARGDASAPVRDYLGGAALTAALDGAVAEHVVRSSTFHLRQELELGFYSDDGSIVAVRAPAVDVVRVIDGGADRARRVESSSEVWRFVMILQDGNWRLHQLEVVDAESEPSVHEPLHLDRPIDGVNSVTVNGVDPTWRSFDPAVGIAELDLIGELGQDTVRVFVAAPELGPVDVDRVRTFLDAAAARGISVVPVLFDGRGDHSVENWRADHSYLDEVVGSLAGHEAIALWDLKNEPDLDDDRSGGATIVDAWVDRVARRVRLLDPETPLTVGWSSAAHAPRVVHAVDVVSFHHFGDAAELDRALDELAGRLGGRELVVSEFGRPAWVGFVRGSQPAAQARRVDELLDVIDEHELGGSLVWVLRDPDRPIEPGVVAGRASRSYGLFDAAGDGRPVARVIESGGTDIVADPATIEWIRAGAMPIALVICVATAIVAAVRRGRRRLIES